MSRNSKNAKLSNSALAKLLTPLGWELLQNLPPYDETQALTLGSSLRKVGVDPELSAALLTQSRLRAKAASKFGEFVDGMLFTSDGLEQATRLVVAATHANRYRTARCTRIADLTCGIGADSLAFAGAGLNVVACDLDEATAAIASWNLRMFDNVEVRCADGLITAREGTFDGLYADPARRSGGERVFDASHYQPSLNALLELRSVEPALGIKVGPGLPHNEIPDDAEAQWVSVDGDVVECGLWFGPLAPAGPGITALLLESTPDGVRSRLIAPGDGPDLDVGPIGQFLYEPDGAVIRAGLLDVAAAELNAHQIDSTIAYLTGDEPPRASSEIPLATAYRVIDVLPQNVKQLKSYLRERDIGRVTIKKRGTDVTPEKLRAQLALRGENEATLVLTRIAGQHKALIVEPGLTPA